MGRRSIFYFLSLVLGSGLILSFLPCLHIPVAVAGTDIPCYAIVEPSGCHYYQGKIQVRIDLFLNEHSEYYNRYYYPEIVWNSTEWLDGYPGEVDQDGFATNATQYELWYDSLPRELRNHPFHHHFIYVDSAITQDELSARISHVRDYFYAFHWYCWSRGLSFIKEWKKVPYGTGDMRPRFHPGTESEGQCLGKLAWIVANANNLRQGYGAEDGMVDLDIGLNGTIDVGSSAVNRATTMVISAAAYVRTAIDYNNSANGDGSLDTVQAYFDTAAAGNTFRVGTFEPSGGTNFTCRDAQEIGEVSGTGAKEYTGLDIDVETGDYIGADGKQAGVDLTLDRDSSGGSGVYQVMAANCVPLNEDTYTIYAGDILSLYGTGDEDVGCTPDSLVVTPSGDTNYCGTNHTFTANLTCSGSAAANVSITWSLAGTGTVLNTLNTTNASGLATANITSSTVGNGTMLCYVTANSSVNGSAWKYWQCANATSIVLQPPYSTDLVGNNESFVATAYGCGSVFANATVVWNTSGVGWIVTCENVTDAWGQADCMISSNASGNQTLNCTINGTAYTDSSVCLWYEEFIPIAWWYFVILGAAVVGGFYTKSILLYILAILACSGGVWWIAGTGLPDLIRFMVIAVLVVLIGVFILLAIRNGEFSFVRGGDSE